MPPWACASCVSSFVNSPALTVDPACDHVGDESVTALFARVARLFANRSALVLGETSVSYAELDRRSNQLANFLRPRLGSAPGLVGLCAGRSIELVVAQLAILKAGAAYVPLDATLPRERYVQMVRHAGLQFLLVQPHLRENQPDEGLDCIVLDPRWEFLAQVSAAPPSGATPSDRLAYVIHTSGSTGRPKGVAISHRSIARLVRDQNYFAFGPDERFLLLSSPAFDAATFEVWGALLNGAACVIYPERWPDARSLEETIRAHRVTVAFLTTRLFNRIIDHRPSALATLRHVLVGGEALSIAHMRRALDLLPGVAFVNVYGPTECTTFASYHPISADDLASRLSVPIGRPIRGASCHLVDEQLRAVSAGSSGELLLGGDGLATGYLRDPALTAEKFVECAPAGVPGRYYRTGDRCRLLADGALEFLGRLDAQVKIRGFRVELEEIELALGAHPAVRESAVFLEDGSDGSARLIACVVPASATGQVDVPALRAWLAAKLPDYMLPSLFRLVAALPMTPRGKLDRGALPRLAAREFAGDAAPIFPRTLTEERLLTIWREALGDSTLGIRDNFFARGGDSLLALRVAIESERAFSRRLPVGALFSCPTVETLAHRLADTGLVCRDPAAPVLGGRGSAAPLFFIPGLQGYGFLPPAIAHRLDGHRPFYDGLLYPGLAAGEKPAASLEEIAAHLLRQIREIHPIGRLALAGYSFGGEVAFELAHQLHAEGRVIDRIILWDSDTNISEEKRPWLSVPYAVARHLATASASERALFLATRWRRLRLLTKARLRRAWSAATLPGLPTPAASTLGRSVDRVASAALAARAKYRYRPLDQRAGLIRSTLRPFQISYRFNAATLNGWDGLFLRGLEVREIACTHQQIKVEPALSLVADHFAAMLSENPLWPA